jgi:hypothetical protein
VHPWSKVVIVFFIRDLTICIDLVPLATVEGTASATLYCVDGKQRWYVQVGVGGWGSSSSHSV